LAFLTRIAIDNKKSGIWPGILVGDMSQPRGGPMITGHASHQIGLDADLWLRPMPNQTLSPAEREEMLSENVVREDGLDINPSWTPSHLAFIRSLAVQPEVQRIFVNPAIKKAICNQATGNRSWLSKVRPEHGHNYHIHVRLFCPKESHLCSGQDPTPTDEGCDGSLDWWFQEHVLHPKPPRKPYKAQPMTVADLPEPCRSIGDGP
jgi:penicillin-insensitive murein endopeptidase